MIGRLTTAIAAASMLFGSSAMLSTFEVQESTVAFACTTDAQCYTNSTTGLCVTPAANKNKVLADCQVQDPLTSPNFWETVIAGRCVIPTGQTSGRCACTCQSHL